MSDLKYEEKNSMEEASPNSSIQVAVRIRPLIESEIIKSCASVVRKQVVDGQPQVVFPGDRKPFAFNHVFDQIENQTSIYEESVAPLIGHLFKGFNATILAYGQTGSGKTYTMGTVVTGDETAETSGIIPRAISHIYEKIDELEGHKVETTCSFFEVYNEQIFDLLTGKPREESTRDLCKNNVKELVERKAMDPHMCLEHLMEGSKLRSTGATKMNKASSRSHAVFSINLKCSPLEGEDPEVQSKFLLVDLAGSERCKKTAAKGDRFKEGVNINKGLFSLGKVINALCDKKTHIPYRDSVLTRVLEESLGGNSYTLMIACVSPADYNTEETTNTLNYANRAKNIKNKPIKNVDTAAMELKSLREQIQQLQMALFDKNPDAVLNNGAEIHRLKTLNNQLVIDCKNLLDDKAALMMENTNLDCRATMMEELYEDVQRQVLDLKGNLCQFIDKTDEEPDLGENVKKIFFELDDRLTRFKSDRSSSLIDHQNGDDEHAAMQVELQEKIRDINKQMQIKEQLLHRMQSNQNLTAFNPNQTFEVTSYAETIEALQKELEELRNKEKFKDKKDTNTQKLSEDRRKKIQDLEARINELQRRCKQQEQMLKIKQRDSDRVKTLAQEITAMRQEKVRIMRQMKQETDQFRVYRNQREKEVNKLKEQDRKRQNEIIRKEAMHQKQQQVMRRKMDEAMSLIKRLKETSNKQAAVRKQKDSKTSDVIGNLQHELEIIHSVIDAKITEKQLRDDRAVLSIRMNELKQQDAHGNAVEIASLDQEIKARTAQIADFQQQVNSTSIDAKVKDMQDRVQTIIDLKSALRYLIKHSIEAREKSAETNLMLNDLKTHNEVLEEERDNVQKEMVQLKNLFALAESEIQRNHEEKIIVLLHEIESLRAQRKLNESFNGTMSDGFTTKMTTIVQELHDELEIYRARITELEAILDGQAQPKKKKAKMAKFEETFDANASIMELESSGSDDEESDTDKDPEWRMTPLAKRVRKSRALLRTSFAVPTIQAKKLSEGQQKCACKGNCSTKLCSCRKRGDNCCETCKCTTERCVNKVTVIPETPEKQKLISDTQNVDPNATFVKPEAASSFVTPIKNKLSDLDLTTPSPYVYANKKRKPFFNN